MDDPGGRNVYGCATVDLRRPRTGGAVVRDPDKVLKCPLLYLFVPPTPLSLFPLVFVFASLSLALFLCSCFSLPLFILSLCLSFRLSLYLSFSLPPCLSLLFSFPFSLPLFAPLPLSLPLSLLRTGLRGWEKSFRLLRLRDGPADSTPRLRHVTNHRDAGVLQRYHRSRDHR